MTGIQALARAQEIVATLENVEYAHIDICTDTIHNYLLYGEPIENATYDTKEDFAKLVQRATLLNKNDCYLHVKHNLNILDTTWEPASYPFNSMGIKWKSIED